MKIDRFLQLFIVKEKKFFPLFKQQGEYICEAGKLLVKMIQEPDKARQQAIQQEIRKIEGKGDTITASINQELHRSFVTPFDRDDMQLFVSRLDSVLDLINETAKRIELYQPVQLHPNIIEMIRQVARVACVLSEVTEDLEQVRKKSDKMIQRYDILKVIEHDCDDLYEETVCDLFKDEKNAIELIKLKEIASSVEETTDKAKDVGHVLLRIIMKLS